MLNEAASRSRSAADVGSESIGGILAAYDNTTTSKIHPGSRHSWPGRTHSAILQPVRLRACTLLSSVARTHFLPGWLYYLIKERKLSASSVNIAVNAVRFLYGVTLERNTDQLMASVPRMKHAIRRAEIYARSEVEAILSAPRQPRDRVFLMTVYACGLRLAEARHLKTTDIDRARMQLRVRKGKGGKERVLPLSNRLLKELGDYWRAQRQGKWGHDIPWLFLGYRAEPICTT